MEELRERAVDERLSGSCSMRGGGAELVSDIEAAGRDQPLNERRCGALVVALYRAGRQADALAALRRTANLLRDDLGPDARARASATSSGWCFNHDPYAARSGGCMRSISDRPLRTRSRRRSTRRCRSPGRGRGSPATRLSTTALETARSRRRTRAMVCRSLIAQARITSVSGEDRTDADPALLATLPRGGDDDRPPPTGRSPTRSRGDRPVHAAASGSATMMELVSSDRTARLPPRRATGADRAARCGSGDGRPSRGRASPPTASSNRSTRSPTSSTIPASSSSD